MGRIVFSILLEGRNGMRVVGVEKRSEQQIPLFIFRRGVKRGGLSQREFKASLIFSS